MWMKVCTFYVGVRERSFFQSRARRIASSGVFDTYFFSLFFLSLFFFCRYNHSSGLRTNLPILTASYFRVPRGILGPELHLATSGRRFTLKRGLLADGSWHNCRDSCINRGNGLGGGGSGILSGWRFRWRFSRCFVLLLGRKFIKFREFMGWWFVWICFEKESRSLWNLKITCKCQPYFDWPKFERFLDGTSRLRSRVLDPERFCIYFAYRYRRRAIYQV